MVDTKPKYGHFIYFRSLFLLCFFIQYIFFLNISLTGNVVSKLSSNCFYHKLNIKNTVIVLYEGIKTRLTPSKIGLGIRDCAEDHEDTEKRFNAYDFCRRRVEFFKYSIWHRPFSGRPIFFRAYTHIYTPARTHAHSHTNTHTHISVERLLTFNFH